MTTDEAVEIVATLAMTASPSSWPRPRRIMWAAMIRDLEFATAREAVEELIRHEKSPGSLGLFMEYYRRRRYRQRLAEEVVVAPPRRENARQELPKEIKIWMKNKGWTRARQDGER